jgi:N-acetylglucosamine kinase-like BadF-type ATPase
MLTELVLAEMHLANPTELIHAVYDKGLQRRAIAGIAALVQSAADAGDATAAEILMRAGAELSAAAASVIGRLGMRGDVFRTVLAGGIFHAIPALVADVRLRLSEVAPRSDTQLLTVEPAIGAVRLALAAANGSVSIPEYV